MSEKPSYEELEKRVRDLERALAERETSADMLMEKQMCFRTGHDRHSPENGDKEEIPELSDIIDVNAIQSMMEDFYAVTGAFISIRDIQGRVLVAVGWQDICTRFHRVHSETSQNCVESNIRLSNGIKPGTFGLYRCKNSMWDLATPITVDGRRLGNLLFGQFLFEGEEPDTETFRAQARKYGFDEKEYLAALERVPRWSREKATMVMRFYTKLARLISETGYSNLRLARILKEKGNALQSLREKTEELERYFSTSLDLFCIADTDGYIHKLNPRWEKVLGYAVKDLDGQRFPDMVHPDDLEATLQAVARLENQEQVLNFVNRYRCKDGTYRWLEWCSSSPHGKLIYAAARDITERVQMEESLMQSEEKFRLAFRTSPDAINLNRASDGLYTEINEGFTKIMGYTREECLGKTSLELGIWKSPEDRERLIAMLKKQGIAENMEAAFRRKDGEIRIGLMSACLLHINGEKIILSLTRDITDRKRAEEELRKLAEAVSQASEGIVITATDGRIIYANPAFSHITGYTKEEVIGQTPRILKSGEQNDVFYKDMWETILSGKRWAGRIINRRRDSTLFTAECSISPVKNREGRTENFVWITRDISKETELEKRVAQAQKMEAIGALAGGIAHDFNNILFPIMGFSEMLLDDIPKENPAHGNIQQIFTAAVRARDLVKQILAFSRQSSPLKMPMQIQPVLKEVMKLSRATIPANIELTGDIDKKCGMVLADPIRIHQVSMNLITNAYHAVEEKGGSIHMELTERRFGEDDLPGPAMKAGTYVCLAVSDTGSGIDKSVISKIFDPYFTTKPLGKGTGMGLSVVHGIVREYGGDIRVYSETGKGSVFHVYFPLLENTGAERNTLELLSPPTGTERILLVDDEEQIVRMVRMMLEKMGYRIAAYTGSPEALAAFRAGPENFDLVITDMSMPEMTGLQLAGELRRIRPDIPLIICTGFSEKINPRKSEEMGIKGFIMKPVMTDELAAMIRKVLDESAGTSADNKDNKDRL